jgi:hypothetical protein
VSVSDGEKKSSTIDNTSQYLKPFFSLSLTKKLKKLTVPGKLFQHGSIFSSKAGANTSEAPEGAPHLDGLLSLSSMTMLKRFPEANTPAKMS